jgi:hypothetical protein
MHRSITLTFTFKDNESPDDDFTQAKTNLINFCKDALSDLEFEDLKIE